MDRLTDGWKNDNIDRWMENGYIDILCVWVDRWTYK